MGARYTFKRHFLTTAERLWLQEAARPGFFPRLGLEELKGRIPDDFRPQLIDSRLYDGNRIKPIALWHLDPRHPQLDILDRVIRAIRERIPRENIDVPMTRPRERH